MERVTGIGGIFFKARDPRALAAWYGEHLGVPLEAWGGAVFRWGDGATPERPGTTSWSIMPEDTRYLDPGRATFMINYRVGDLDAMLAQLRGAGAAVDDRVEESEWGRFGWAMDPEGNRFELWQPPEGM